MKSVELKIKAKHLALEPAIIKKEERELKKMGKYLREKQESDSSVMRKLHSLQQHRKEDVRWEARATHLARAYLAGQAYTDVEQKRKQDKEFYFRWKIMKRIVSMVNKYRDRQTTSEVTIDDIAKWCNV